MVIYPKHVKNMLNGYLNGKYSSNDLNSWARFICHRAEYGVPNFRDNDIADYYEDMYYVIQKLSTPEIDGEINHESVKLYLRELDKYSKEE